YRIDPGLDIKLRQALGVLDHDLSIRNVEMLGAIAGCRMGLRQAKAAQGASHIDRSESSRSERGGLRIRNERSGHLRLRQRRLRADELCDDCEHEAKSDRSRVVRPLHQALEELVGRGGFEPPTNGLKVRCSTS